LARVKTGSAMRDFKKSKNTSYDNMKGGELDNQDTKYAQHEPVQALPLEIRVHNGNFDKALRAFRTLVQKERILSTYKEKQKYEKPSDKKRRKRSEAARKRLENEMFRSRKHGEE
jgi:small subunit ribosomal protein S21